MNAIEPRPVPDTLTFVRLCVDIRQLYQVGRERGWGKRGRADHFDEGRALHHALTETFGEKALPLFRPGCQGERCALCFQHVVGETAAAER